jgi:hypothetical protein
MTTNEILQLEENNTNLVVLYREGMFWKAYERSAYLICTQIHPFRVTTHYISKLAGASISSIGFPDTSLEKFMGKYHPIARSYDSITYSGFHSVNEQDFLIWKERQSLPKAPTPQPTQAPTQAPTPAPKPEPRKPDTPFYQLPVYRKTQDLYQKVVTNKVLESIPKATKKRMLEPTLKDLMEILVDIYEVRELERLLDKGETPFAKEMHRDTCRLLLEAKRKAARCIIAFRLIFDTKVESPHKLLLVPQDLYEEYAENLVSIHHQLGFWARKHEELCK